MLKAIKSSIIIFFLIPVLIKAYPPPGGMKGSKTTSTSSGSLAAAKAANFPTTANISESDFEAYSYFYSYLKKNISSSPEIINLLEEFQNAKTPEEQLDAKDKLGKMGLLPLNRPPNGKEMDAILKLRLAIRNEEALDEESMKTIASFMQGSAGFIIETNSDQNPTGMTSVFKDDAFSAFRNLMGNNADVSSLLYDYKEQSEEFQIAAEAKKNAPRNLPLEEGKKIRSAFYGAKLALEQTVIMLKNKGLDLKRPPTDEEMTEILKLRMSIANGNDNVLDDEGRNTIGSYFRESSNRPIERGDRRDDDRKRGKEKAKDKDK